MGGMSKVKPEGFSSRLPPKYRSPTPSRLLDAEGPAAEPSHPPAEPDDFKATLTLSGDALAALLAQVKRVNLSEEIEDEPALDSDFDIDLDPEPAPMAPSAQSVSEAPGKRRP